MNYEKVGADNQTHLIPEGEGGRHNVLCACPCGTREYDIGWAVIVTHEPMPQTTT